MSWNRPRYCHLLRVLPFTVVLPIAVFVYYLSNVFVVVRRSTWLCRVDGLDRLDECDRPTGPRWSSRLFGLWLPDDMVTGICRFAFLANDVSFWLKNNIHGESKSKLLILSEYVNNTEKIAGTWANTNSYMYTERQEATLSPRDRAMRRANCHTTVQKLIVRQVLNKLNLWSWRVTLGQCVINMCTQPWRDRVASIVL